MIRQELLLLVAQVNLMKEVRKNLKSSLIKLYTSPSPDYTTRRLIWKTFIEQLGGVLKPEFPLSTLAHISAGYSSGSIRKTCEKVLTLYRKKHVKTFNN